MLPVARDAQYLDLGFGALDHFNGGFGHPQPAASAALAAPCSGAARTRTLSTGPAAACSTPSTRSWADLGVSRTLMRRPSAMAVHGVQGRCRGELN